MSPASTLARLASFASLAATIPTVDPGPSPSASDTSSPAPSASALPTATPVPVTPDHSNAIAKFFSFIPSHDLGLVIGGVVAFWLLLYLLYRVTFHPDFGLPIRRKFLRVHLRVDDEQIAFVPWYWPDFYVQRAIDRYWENALREVATAKNTPATAES